MRRERLEYVAAAMAGALLVGIHFAVFVRFFPNQSGLLGNDYALFLTHQLDGYFLWNQHGLFATPWFTPSFCGGLPKFANPQSLYYSLPQLATNLTDPLNGLRITLLVSAAAGYAGTWALLRRSFGVGRPAALLGATFFLFNGLFWARMAIGHLTFHGFMFAPLLACFVLGPARDDDEGRWRAVIDLSGAAVLLAYLAMTSLAHSLLQVIVATLLLLLLRAVITSEQRPVVHDLARLGVAGIVAIGLAAAKLVAMASYLQHFPRDLYRLPGVAGIGSLLELAFQSVFLGASGPGPSPVLANSSWTFDQQEFEYGIGLVPLVLLAAALPRVWQSVRGEDARAFWTPARLSWLGTALLLLCIPLALNYYSPGWNALLKSLPFIGSGSTQLRWFAVYIPVFAVLAAVAFDRTPRLLEQGWIIAGVGVVVTVGMSVATDRTYYERQSFDPGPLLMAHARVATGARPPVIERIATARDAQGQPTMRFDGNSSFARGESELLCYAPLMGYRLENFPRGSLRAGRALSVRDGVFNIKDPACYVFPEENACVPGDHFTEARRADAEAFVRYQPYPFERSGIQVAANFVTGLSATGVFVALGWAVSSRLRRRQP